MEQQYFGAGKQRYETRGINQNLPVEYRVMLWYFVEKMHEKVKLDYLQIFKFKVEKNVEGILVQKVTHCQEQPEFSHTYEFPLSDVWIRENVYIIDDTEQCIMLWANEY